MSHTYCIQSTFRLPDKILSKWTFVLIIFWFLFHRNVTRKTYTHAWYITFFWTFIHELCCDEQLVLMNVCYPLICSIWQVYSLANLIGRLSFQFYTGIFTLDFHFLAILLHPFLTSDQTSCIKKREYNMYLYSIAIQIQNRVKFFLESHFICKKTELLYDFLFHFK